jgi:F-type H+-transporting ATPase subunit b
MQMSPNTDESTSTLQEALAVLLGAESEAKRVVDDSKSESEGFLRTAQEKFTGERANQMASAREQAKGIMENALNSAKTEAEQIADLGKEERKRMQRRFEENVDSVIDSIVAKVAKDYIFKRRA